MGQGATAIIVRASEQERAALAEMVGPYLSELGAASEYPYLDLYWSEEGRFPYLIQVADRNVGFALIRRLETGVTEMAEFHVLAAWRERSVGRAAAAALFALHPGPWRVRAFPNSVVAETFWRKVLPPGAQGVRDDGAWVYSFTVAEGTSNKSLDTDTHRQGAAKRAGEPTPRGARPVRAGQLRR